MSRTGRSEAAGISVLDSRGFSRISRVRVNSGGVPEPRRRPSITCSSARRSSARTISIFNRPAQAAGTRRIRSQNPYWHHCASSARIHARIVRRRRNIITANKSSRFVAYGTVYVRPIAMLLRRNITEIALIYYFTSAQSSGTYFLP